MNIDELSEKLMLSLQGKEQLRNHIRQFTFEHSGPVIHKGQAVSGAYVVMQGQLRVYAYSPEGNEATLYLLRPGETCVLTLNCLFNNLRYPAWVDANPNTKVAFIPGDIYRKLFAQEPGIQDTTVKALSTLVFKLMDALEEVKTCNLEQQLARFLLNNANISGELQLTQQELANHIGTTREGIARLMQGFKSAGMVATARGRVCIKDETALASIVTPAHVQWPDQL